MEPIPVNDPRETAEFSKRFADKRFGVLSMFGAAGIVGGPVRIIAIEGAPLSVPLRDPFVIATGRIDVTRAVLVRATLEDEGGRRAVCAGL